MTDIPPRFVLDSAGDAVVPDGYLLVNTEAGFLSHALGSVPMVVRGSSLCRWAEDFCVGRNLPWKRAQSPLSQIQAICRMLTAVQAQHIYALLGAKYQELPQQANVTDVLQALYPEGPWQIQPFHSAHWLLWLDSTEPPPELQPLFAQLAQQWQSAFQPSEPIFYTVHDAASARTLLEQWMGITGTEACSFGPFPLPVPSRWRERARLAWSEESLSERTSLLDRVRCCQAPHALLEVAAELSAQYYKYRPEKLTPEQVKRLGTYLTYESLSDLHALCPPEKPSPLPDTAPAVLSWFTNQYLPFRQWEVVHGDKAAHTWAEELARQFSLWCLAFYPIAIAGGLGQSHLAIHQAKQLRNSRHGYLTLWVIFDGLTYGDGQSLVERLSQHPRLSEEAAFPVLSALPTITSFCKRALIHAVPPALVMTEDAPANWGGARILERNKDPKDQLASGNLGNVFIWSLTEPDKTYHAHFDAITIRRNVQSQLENWVAKIIGAALSVPDALPVRIVFSTDHGRLMTSGNRQLTVPDGMEAHGRAAYGNANKKFDLSGTHIEKGIVYLDRDRFRLPVDCAVALGSDVFKTSDGKTGEEQFPHGGLYPEEVLIPWVEFVRDRRTPTIRCVLSGQGRAGAEGTLTCRFENLGSFPVTAAALRFAFGSESRSLSISCLLPAMEETMLDVTLSNWPTNFQLEQAAATIEYGMLNGTSYESAAALELKSVEMQRRDVSLEDL